MEELWSKYSYVCNDCDALIEITTRQNIREWRGWCSCGSANLVGVEVRDATVR
jgi:DNA-directed RNA polymerase subunit RPC12/RpoP